MDLVLRTKALLDSIGVVVRRDIMAAKPRAAKVDLPEWRRRITRFR